MRRYERTKVLTEGDPDIARRIAGEVEQVAAVKVVEAPREELVMVKVRESARRSLFYLGEALMTSCRVDVDGTCGRGMVLGSDREAAYALAVADAAFSAAPGRFDTAAWEVLLEAEASRLAAEEAARFDAIAATKVDFSTMDGER